MNHLEASHAQIGDVDAIDAALEKLRQADRKMLLREVRMEHDRPLSDRASVCWQSRKYERPEQHTTVPIPAAKKPRSGRTKPAKHAFLEGLGLTERSAREVASLVDLDSIEEHALRTLVASYQKAEA